MSRSPPSIAPSSITRRWLPLIIGLAIGIRIALALVHSFSFPDSADYDALAKALLEGRSYAVGGNLASRMPGYPLFIAAIYAIAGYSAQAVLIVQALLAFPIIALSYQLARRHSPVAGVLAAVLIAFDPLTIGFSTALLSEMPFTLCLLIAVWLGKRLLERPSWRLWIGLGLAWGIAVLLRASALWCIVPLAAWISVAARAKVPPAQRLLGPLLALALTFALLTPWLMRNYQHFHTGPFRLTTLEGISLYESVYPGADGGPRQDQIVLPPEMQSLNEAQRNDEWSRRAWSYIASDPARIARLALIKIGRTWSPWFNAAEMQSSALRWGMTLWYVPLYLLALSGVARARVSGPEKILWLIPILYFMLLHSLFLGSVRYRAPLMPLVCIFAACGLTHLASRVNLGRNAKRSAAPSV